MCDIKLNHFHNENTTSRSDISSQVESGSLNGDRYERKCPDVAEIESQNKIDFISISSLSKNNSSNNSSNEVIVNPDQHVFPEPNPDKPKIENIALTNSSQINVGDRAITHVRGQVIYNRIHIPQIINSVSNDQSK